MNQSLLLLPGMMLDERLWAPVQDYLDRAITAVTPDFGDSATIAGFAQHVLSLAPLRFCLAGFSLGAIVALEIWRQAPDRITAVALIGFNPSKDPAEREQTRLGQIERTRRGELIEMISDTFIPRYFANESAQCRHSESVVTMANTLGPATFERQTCAQLARPDSWSSLPTISVPVSVICGKQDALVPPAVHEKVHAAIPGSRFSCIESAGHLLPLEQPEALATELNTLCRSAAQ